MADVLLTIENLTTHFNTDAGLVKAVNGVSFNIERRKTIGIVGESGCGKSVMATSVMHLLPGNGRIAGGRVVFEGVDIAKASAHEMRKINGDKISMIFQEPMTSLNPVFTVGYQIEEVLLLHETKNRSEAKKKSIEMINTVGIPRAEGIYKAYPHELSGGMRQRIMIAMALVCKPSLLIADEPTTALDVTIQAQILDLMRRMKDDLGMSIMLITHDLGVIAEMADYVVVMYAGRVAEQGPVKDIFAHPLHPYTQGLLNSIPEINETKDRLYSIPGRVPSLTGLPDRCNFCDRCEKCTSSCLAGFPPDIKVDADHIVACTLYKGNKFENQT